MNDDTVIPPVDAGLKQSKLTVERREERSWKATGIHRWDLDVGAYYDITGLDLGNPEVHQENGHDLRVIREYRWREILGREGDRRVGSVSIQEAGVRGRRMKMELWSREGRYKTGYRSTDHHGKKWHVDETMGELPNIAGNFYDSMADLVRQYHGGHIVPVPDPDELFERLLREDSPDDAIPVEEYEKESLNRCGI